jgi:hypothetical protein
MAWLPSSVTAESAVTSRLLKLATSFMVVGWVAPDQLARFVQLPEALPLFKLVQVNVAD